MTLRLYDTAAGEVRDFVPLQEGKAGIYVCGLTVQSEPHVGHVRSAVNFDVLRRWLVASGYDVTFIRNITDIDDKILAQVGRAGPALVQPRLRHEAASSTRRTTTCNVLPPTYEPAATGHVPEMIELIATLIERGHAYPAEDGSGDVYFDVRSWPSYGELTHQGSTTWRPPRTPIRAASATPATSRSGRGTRPTSRRPQSWPSPWGRGRPGWHIECSAMAGKYLGAAFDIHGGGVDLRFPHHENEQAQSRAAGRGFASYWLHNAWITTVRGEDEQVAGQLAARARGAQAGARHRAALLHGGRALPLARWSSPSRRSTRRPSAFRRIEGFLQRAADLVGGPLDAVGMLCAEFIEAMDDDLGTPAAVAAIHDVVREGNKLLGDGDSAALRGNAASVRAMLGVLGLDPADPHWSAETGRAAERLGQAVDALVARSARPACRGRAAKDFATADADPRPDRGRRHRGGGHPGRTKWSIGGVD